MNRRTFLEGSAVLGAACALSAQAQSAKGPEILTPDARSVRFSDAEVQVPDDGWRMWPDRAAEWKDDTIYLPEDVDLKALPVNPPTGGWQVLSSAQGLPVTLPSTVEQFFWGINGYFPYKDEYKFEATDDEVKNGAYYGVSWWWRDLNVPRSFGGKRVLLHVRGARQRAEVYLNGALVGYSILEELPFECDLTGHARPGGSNQLAIRITNPGGRLDWVDNVRMSWGGMEIQKSHGFGGLDRGIVLSAHGPLRIADSWARNTPVPRQISGHASIENTTNAPVEGRVRFSVLESRSDRVLATADVPLTVAAGKAAECKAMLTAPGARIWDLDTPHVYRLRSEWIGPESRAHAMRDVDFGFRWITTDGIGSDAVFQLNGRRIRIYTAISWGFWALNGLFPSRALAEKEVRRAKELNLNTLNFHRNLGKEDVLYVQDRLGLMRCLEPGGGAQALIPAAQGHESVRRYTRAKIRGMIRAFRSHPSVVHYIVQNEVTLNPTSPEVAEIFAMMQAEDPSRTIVGNDGFVLRSPQAWSQPYSSQVLASNGKATLEGGAGGWWVDHTGHFSDVWQDSYYISKNDFYYDSPIRKEIVEWGEMKGAASIDNHASVLRQIARNGGSSYDRLDHEQQLAAYEAFLDRWGFREAFPTAEKLFLSIGLRAYESWGQFLENVRICDENDMAAISGWESTAMENHSGLVDNFRDWKADPRCISQSLQPLHPIAKQKQLVVQTGGRATLDTWLLNDTQMPATGRLHLTLQGPGMRETQFAAYDPPAHRKGQFSYLLQEDLQTPALTSAGLWKAKFMVEGRPETAQELSLLAVDPAPAGERPLQVAFASVSPQVMQALRTLPQISLVPFEAGKHYDAIVASGGESDDASKNLAVDAEGAYKPGKGPHPEFQLAAPVLEAVRAGTPLLAVTPTDGQTSGVARQLAQLGAFRFNGLVGASRASWMGSWYFVRKHPLYDGMPVDQAMSIHYQVKGGGSNGLLVDGPGVEIVCGYGRDHDRNLGAGTFTARLGKTRIVMHRIADMHPVLLRRFLANALMYLRADKRAAGLRPAHRSAMEDASETGSTRSKDRQGDTTPEGKTV